MNDYSDLIAQHLSSTGAQTVTGLDDNPDDAARAVQLSSATGVAAPIIAGDLDGFEADYKARLASNLVVNNPQLRAYVNAHPLAASVSNDDWGNLDTFSQGAQQTHSLFRWLNPVEAEFGDQIRAGVHSVEGVLRQPFDVVGQGAVEGFKEGFGEQDPRVSAMLDPKQNRFGVAGALLASDTLGLADYLIRGMSGGFGAATGAVGAGATAIGGEQFGREAKALTEYEMMKGDSAHVEVGPEAVERAYKGTEAGKAAAASQAFRDQAVSQALAQRRHVWGWLEENKVPPRGVDPEIDAKVAQINAAGVQKLEEDLANAQASATKERSLEMWKILTDSHYQGDTIGISGQAAAELYGDKPPAADDGMLGFVPGIGDQLDLARSTGADVHIPVSDWIANVDPAIAKQLSDHIRIWPDGITAEEAKEPVEPKATVDGPLPQVRGAAGLEPMFSMGDRKLQLQKSLSVLSDPFGERMDRYDILDEGGQPIGQLRIGRGDDKELLVDWIGGQAGMWANSFGPSLVRDLKRQLKELYPDYEYLTGYRISGAREAAGAADELRVPRVRLSADEPSSEDFHATRQILADSWREVGQSGIFGNYAPTSLYSANQIKMRNIVHDEIRKLTGKGPAIHAVAGIKQTGGAQSIKGAYVPHEDRAPTILFDMLGPNPLGVGRHEAIHYLRRYNVIQPEEWDTLEQAALNENWLQRYGIGDRYGHLDIHGQLEEAIAEGFREWAEAGRPTPHGNVAGIFQKIWDFLQSIKQRFAEALGHEPTWEELFQKIGRGEVGKRGPGEAVQPGTYDLQSRMSIDDLSNLQADAHGLDKKTFEKLKSNAEQRYEEDIAAAQARAEKQQARRQSKEWKENRADLRKDVESTIRQRPDVAADLFIGSGELYGKKIQQRYTLRADDLTPEQRAALPPHYVSKNGLPVDEVARLFGYGSGDAMVDGLAQYHAIRGDLSPQEGLKKVVDLETDRQMEAKYGRLEENILDAAKDQALSESQLNFYADETYAAGLKAGQGPIDFEKVREQIQEKYGNTPIGRLKSDSLMAVLNRHSQNAIKAGINGDFAGQFQALQQRQATAYLAAEVRKLEIAKAKFDKLAKQMSNRAIPSMDPEYTNYVHDILQRIGKPVKRSLQDVEKEIGKSASENFADFVATKSSQSREIPVWPELYDKNWRKNYDDLTVDEFNAISNTVKTLVHNGKDELKIEKAGETADLSIIKTLMIDALKSNFDPINFDAAGGHRAGPGKLRTVLAAHLQMENIFNRLDGYDPHGVWNQYAIRDLIEGNRQAEVWKKEYAKMLRDADDGADLYKTVNNTIFRNPETGRLFQLNRGNLRAVILNMGNDSNLTKFAKGWGLRGEDVQAWVHSIAKKEDFDFAQKIWDGLASLKGRSDTMYRSLTGGVPAEDIKIRPVDTRFGQYKGGYYPVIWHSEFEGTSKKLMGPNALEESNYVRATTPAGYTKARTGYTAPMSFDLDQLPNRIAQEIHDIAMRPGVINASKIFYDHDIRNAMTNYYGKEYTDLLVPYLRDVANVQNFMSKSQAEFNTLSGFFRQNLITTLVGLNPGTIMKHAPTALGLSIKEVGATRFAEAVKSLFSINEQTGETNYAFAMHNSQELQSRDRNWHDTLYGASGALGITNKLGVPSSVGMAKAQFKTLRQTIMELSSKPVALSDKISAVPTWLAAYRKAVEEGSSHGDAIYLADRAVRRAHGSTALTNRPAVMRDSNPWFTSVYNFFNDVMNRQMETLWKAGDTMDLVKEGNRKAAIAMGGSVAAGLAAYVIWPAIVEQMVSPIPHDPKSSWGVKAANGLLFTLSSSWVNVRDVVNGIMEGSDPSAGLITSAYKEISDFARDFGKHQPMSKEHAGKLIQDGMSLSGMLTGMVPGQVGREARFAHDIATGVEHPRGPWSWLVGLRYGTTKKHSTTFRNYLQGKAQ